ncbi:MAG: GAF domain-containing sensor histidine kinase [Anaerolineae bacterium]|nr:GAF domain-containing sensor histidine kinase [Anaerolineae bacterium]
MSSSTDLLPAGLTIAYTLLVLILLRRDREQLGVQTRRWIILALVAAALSAAVFLLPADAHADSRYEALFVGELTQPALAVILANLMIVLFSTQTMRYLQVPGAGLWAVVWLIWWAVQAITSAFEDNLIIGQEGWLSDIYDPVVLPGVLTVGGWFALGMLLLAAAFITFYRAHLAEVANRALFWATIIPLVLMGAVLGTSGSGGLAEIGWVIQFAGLLGATYSILSYRVFDIRRALRHTTATGIVTLIMTLAFFLALVGAQQLDSNTSNLYVILSALALAVALTYVPLLTLIQEFVNNLFGAPAESASRRLRQFSEDITGVVELDALVDVTMRTLRQVLRVRRGGLILVTEEDQHTLCIEPVRRGMGEIPDMIGRLATDSPIVRDLFRSRTPLLQYDLDYGRTYADAAPEEHSFFQQMRMSAYAPVVVQGHPIAILCSGAKASDDPYTEHDLELLTTVANQVGVALRNARLVSDLRRREAEQAELNAVLSDTKEQLEKLDGVKTDFITIASHELRTPLAQIRGYSDIMEAMNEQGLLDQDQIGGMTANLRKAADRLENLIGAMLDVSQLDVDAMDLHFTQTGIETAMRLAIEPLTESIKNRKLMLSARGLRGLPPIMADQQRLVQAFRNVILNAIKYTPDGGRIDIRGRMVDDEILIAVEDHGIGIDPANHELIFEKFFRAHDPSLHSTGATKFMGAGPGLGLTIARGVIEGHGGRIWVESDGCDMQAMPGSTFFIALPLTPPAEATRVLPFESGSTLAHIPNPFGSDAPEDVFAALSTGAEATIIRQPGSNPHGDE